jgi:hypothetical protein
VRVILELGGNTHARSVDTRGHTQLAMALVELGGDLRAQGINPLHMATGVGHLETLGFW